MFLFNNLISPSLNYHVKFDFFVQQTKDSPKSCTKNTYFLSHANLLFVYFLLVFIPLKTCILNTQNPKNKNGVVSMIRMEKMTSVYLFHQPLQIISWVISGVNYFKFMCKISTLLWHNGGWLLQNIIVLKLVNHLHPPFHVDNVQPHL